MELILETVLWIIGIALEIYSALVVAQIVIYWCMHFQIIGQGGDAFKRFLTFLHTITEPVYAKLREKIKPIQGFDISPYALVFIMLVVLHILEKTREVLS